MVLLPQYFLEEKTSHDFPPPITHPEFYYGAIGVTVAWQVLFLVLSGDPGRYRLMMIPAVLEKAGFTIAVAVLFIQHRVSPLMLLSATIDLLFGVLFVAAYMKTALDSTAVLPATSRVADLRSKK